MRRKFLISALLAVLASVITSCVHEFPRLPETTDLTLHLNFDTALPLYKEVTRTRGRTINDADKYDIRHIVSVHSLLPDGSYDRKADTLIVFTCDDVTDLNCTRNIKLPEGEYQFFVWSDFVDEGSQADKYYTPQDFSEIILSDKNGYTGSCDFRDAFRGSAKGSVTVRRDEMTEVDNDVTVTMKRPLAKFQIVSTDFQEFLANVVKAEAQRRNASGSATTTRSINTEDYRIVFQYAGFVPCSYNMFTDKPADSWTGLQFGSTMTPTDDGEMLLGYDYVFVNGAEAGVSVVVSVYDRDGVLVASSPTVEVPLKRSKLTIVRGKFLTSTSNGGLGIDPGFDGEYNIVIR